MSPRENGLGCYVGKRDEGHKDERGRPSHGDLVWKWNSGKIVDQNGEGRCRFIE